MKTMKKLLITLAIVSVIFTLFAIAVSAEATLWERKPESEPKMSGWAEHGTPSGVKTISIKWEIFDLGTASDPYHVIYFSYVPDATGVQEQTDELFSRYHRPGEFDGWNGYGEADFPEKNSWNPLPWYDANIWPTLKAVCVGDGIRSLINGVFAGMTAVEIVELPTSLTIMGTDTQSVGGGSAAFKNMTNLKTVYTRGQTPVEGTVNLSNITVWLDMSGAYCFAGLENVEHYIFPENVNTNQTYIGENFFINNYKLKSINIPAKITTIGANVFAGSTALEEVVLTAKVNSIADNAFSGCENLVIAAPEGSYADTYAKENGFVEKAPTPPPALEIPELGNLWASKPTDREPVKSGYAEHGTTSGVKTISIKWEIYNFGTEDEPYHIMYFSYDPGAAVQEQTTELFSRYHRPGEFDGWNGYGEADFPEKNYWNPLPWYDANIWPTLKAICVGDGITSLINGVFAGMTAVEAVELPTSLTVMGTDTQSVGGGSAAFKNMTNLKTVYTRGQTPVEGTVNFSNITGWLDMSGAYCFAGLENVEHYIFPENVNTNQKYIGENFFINNYKLKSINIPAYITSIGANVFAGCTSLEKITLTANISNIADGAFSGCKSLKFNAPEDSYAYSYGVSHGFIELPTEDRYEVRDGDGNLRATIIYTYSTANLYFDKNEEIGGWWDFDIAKADSFLANYKGTAKSATFEKFSTIRVNTGSVLSDFTALEKVIFAEGQVFHDNSWHSETWWNNKGLFVNCSALTTVYFGDEADAKTGVADFSGMDVNFRGYSDGPVVKVEPYIFTYNLFSGCSAIEEVIFPELLGGKIWANTFANCTSLKSVTIPASFTIIEDGAFNSCTALKAVYLEAPASVIGAGTFSSAMSGVTVYCASISAADAVNTTLVSASIPASSVRATISRGGMTIPGYSIKETGYNGLRTHFAFDETVFDGTGYTLVEYGTLSATKTNWSNFSETFGLENSVITLNGGEFVTPEKIVKTAIYNKTSGYENNSNHNDNSNVKFSVTIVKFQNENQYKSELVSCGYEIWEKNGEYFVLYTREAVMGYDTVSIYKLTLGMLADGAVKVAVDENSPVWTVLDGCEKTPIALENPDITAFLIADPVNEGKYIAVYATATSATLDTYGLTAEELKNVSAIVIGENVVRIESEWKAYIDEKLDSLPEGKSFIVYTDTHMELDQERNTKKAASLIEYVRGETGIKTVVNLGDPYTGEATLEKADKVFKTAVGDYFYDVFGTDGLYVVGNHDANYTTWNSDANGTKGYRVINEAESGKYAYDYLLPDSVIYNETVKNIANKNGIHFNDAMLALVDSLDYDFYASDIGDYTEDDLKEEFKAWAKLHYYYDDEVNNIRYIVLNTGNCGLIEYYLLDSRWTMILSTQLDFFVDALKSTPVGYDIAVLGHQMGYEDGDNTSNKHSQTINEIIAAFKKGEKMEHVQIWYNKTELPNMHVLSRTPDNRNYDFTGISFEGTIFTVSGHWHDERGYVWETKDGSFAAHEYTGEAVADDAVFYIGISNDCLEGTSDDGINHEKGTLTENSFSIITIKEDGNIVVTGFGAATPVRNFNYN